jgi:hypothetical protein
MAFAAVIFWAVRARAQALAACLAMSLVSSAFADDRSTGVDEGFHAIALPGEAWIGAEGFRNVWSIYSGGNYAPFGALTDSGFRLRAVGGTSGYRFTSPRWTGAKTEPVLFQGQSTFIDALAGYQARTGALTAKIFLGATFTKHQTLTAHANYVLANGTAADTETKLNGQHFGAKSALEFWLNMGERAWGSVDLSFASLNLAYTSHMRIGWRATPELSLGPEIGTLGFSDHDQFHNVDVRRQLTRAGLFLRYDGASSEVIIAGGVAQTRGDIATPYATAQYLNRF